VARIFLSPPDVGPRERELLLDAFDSGWIAPLGPHVEGFEREVAAATGVAHAAALSSGTAGLHLALLLLGVGPGDEVITSTLTFAATANAIRYVGAEPVFVDSDRASWNMDPDLLAEELAACAARGRPPAAVIAVDLYGQTADYGRIEPLCREHGVPLIEDAAEAIGATCGGRPAGSFGALGVVSFNGNKLLTTGGGGALVSDREEDVRRARFLATQARDPAPHYQHSVVGYNYRLSNLLAAVGRGQLETLAAKVERRRAHNAAYREALGDLPGVTFMPEAAHGRWNGWLTVLQIDAAALGCGPDDLRVALEALDVEARPVWKPMHLQPVFAACRVRGGAVAEELFARGLCLPSGSGLSDADRARVVAGIRERVGRA